MTLPSLKNSRTPIGIDLGSFAIKAVQLARAGKGKSGWRMHAGASIALPVPNHPFDSHTAHYLRDVLSRHGFVGDDVVVAAPTSQLAVDVLEVPPRSSGAPIEQIVRAELARGAKLDDQPFELECWDLPAPARGGAPVTSVMAVAMRHAGAEALLDPLEAEGFNVVALDTTSWALARAAAPYVAATPDGITALLDVGFAAALVVLVHNGVVIYQRVLAESGVGILARALREEFQLADDEATYILGHGTSAGGVEGSAHSRQIATLVGRYLDSMVAEIQSAFDYASHRYASNPLSGLMLAGGGSAVAGIVEQLRTRLAMEVSILSPARVVECPPALADRSGDGTLTAALGLALHGAR